MKNLTRDELTWPMWGKFRNGIVFWVDKEPLFEGGSINYKTKEGGSERSMPLNCWDDELFCIGVPATAPARDFDIMEVYGEIVSYETLGGRIGKVWDLDALIWRREEETPFCTIDGVEYSVSTLRSLIKKATQ